MYARRLYVQQGKMLQVLTSNKNPYSTFYLEMLKKVTSGAGTTLEQMDTMMEGYDGVYGDERD
jgi:hypothetical protein